jgi:cytochrome P450
MFNIDRLLITSPKALSEVLTTKSYNFAKPYALRAGMSRILGVGILLAEGDEHKVSRRFVRRTGLAD